MDAVKRIRQLGEAGGGDHRWDSGACLADILPIPELHAARLPQVSVHAAKSLRWQDDEVRALAANI